MSECIVEQVIDVPAPKMMTQQRHVLEHHVMTEEVVRQILVQVVQQIVVPVPQPFVQTVEKFVEVLQERTVETLSPVP